MGFYTTMLEAVSLQLVFMQEFCLTFLALVWFDPTVSDHMGSEIWFIFKRLITFGAWKVAISMMKLVFGHCRFLRKRLMADVAFMWFFTSVTSYVSAQVGGKTKRCFAMRALMWLEFHVILCYMLFHVGGLTKCLITMWADMGLPYRVVCNVSLQT